MLATGLQAALPPPHSFDHQHSSSLSSSDQQLAHQLVDGLEVLSQLREPRWTDAVAHAALNPLMHVVGVVARGQRGRVEAHTGSGWELISEGVEGLQREAESTEGETHKAGMRGKRPLLGSYACEPTGKGLLAARVARALLMANCHWSEFAVRELLRECLCVCVCVHMCVLLASLPPTKSTCVCTPDHLSLISHLTLLIISHTDLLNHASSTTTPTTLLPFNSHLHALTAVLHLRTTSSHLRIPFYNQNVSHPLKPLAHTDAVLAAAGEQLMHCVHQLQQHASSDSLSDEAGVVQQQTQLTATSTATPTPIDTHPIYEPVNAQAAAARTDALPSLPLTTLLPMYQSLSTLLSPSLVAQAALDFEASTLTQSHASPSHMHTSSSHPHHFSHENTPLPSSSLSNILEGDSLQQQLPLTTLRTLVAASEQLNSHLQDAVYTGLQANGGAEGGVGLQGTAVDATAPDSPIHR